MTGTRFCSGNLRIINKNEKCSLIVNRCFKNSTMSSIILYVHKVLIAGTSTKDTTAATVVNYPKATIKVAADESVVL